MNFVSSAEVTLIWFPKICHSWLHAWQETTV